MGPRAGRLIVLGKQQVWAMLRAPRPASPLYRRDIAILELLYGSGIRASELCGLGLHDVSLPQALAHVIGKGRKERIVPIGRHAAEAIDRYASETRPRLNVHRLDRLFLSRVGRPLNRHKLRKIVQRHARRGGILGRVSTHTIRHSYATHLMGGGADLRVIQELLGHADLRTTQIYTHIDASRLKYVHKMFHPRV